MKEGLLGVRRQLLNNVNTGINFSTADNESYRSSTHCSTAMFVTSNETFFVSQTPSLLLSKSEDLEDESPKRKKSISGNRIIDVNIFSVVFLERCYVLNV